LAKALRLGTRGSPLALKQAQIVYEKIRSVFPDQAIDIVPLFTKGDLDLKTPLSQLGGKGVFIKEVELALLENRIDIAVHSFKDITSTLSPITQLAGYFKPESSEDVVLLKQPYTLQTLPKGTVLATGSIRRKAFLQLLRPDIECVGIRGNIHTRIETFKAAPWEGLVLSEAGLLRMAIRWPDLLRFEPEQMIPAPGQGVIALQTRLDDPLANTICEAVGDQEQWVISSLERELLVAVGFDCRIPLGCRIQWCSATHVEVYIKVFKRDSFEFHTEHFTCLATQAADKVFAVGQSLKQWMDN